MKKVILIQFHTDIVSPPGDGIIDEYYKNIWTQKGYMKPDEFWELPKWAGEMTYLLKSNNVDVDFKVLMKPVRLHKDVETIFACSCLNANKHLIKAFMDLNPENEFILGGYTDPDFFNDSKCAVFGWYDSLKQLSVVMDLNYEYGVDWSLFKGYSCIPRITLSTGCGHDCKFCTIPNKITPIEDDYIMQQIYALIDLDFKLIYIDDKTFGQCSNYRRLVELNEIVRQFNPDFMGFIIQTTARQVSRIDFSYLGVYAVEIGVETYNNHILSDLNKPADVDLIEEASDILQKEHINFIPNIVVGFPAEDVYTYNNTISYLDRLIKEEILLHANVYNLAIYEDSELSTEINSKTPDDSNELSTNKSYQSGVKNLLDETVTKVMATMLNRHIDNIQFKPSTSRRNTVLSA